MLCSKLKAIAESITILWQLPLIYAIKFKYLSYSGIPFAIQQDIVCNWLSDSLAPSLGMAS